MNPRNPLNRRRFLGGAAAAGASLSALTLPGLAASDNYKALVVVYLNGGNDANNVLVPNDAGYRDYQTARANLALPQSSLRALQGSPGGRRFGLHPALEPLVPLYTGERLAFIANTGTLVEPCTAAEVIANSKRVPPFLLSHNDQTAIVQGWTVQDDSSGWAGRALEKLPSELRHAQQAITMDTNRTLVLGKNSAVTFMPAGGLRYWGSADIAFPERPLVQNLNRLSRLQFGNDYEAEYAATLGGALGDATKLTRILMAATPPTADFGSDAWLGNNLRTLASMLPGFRAQGYRRQVFLVHWGGFDTHTNQRGSIDPNTQDSQLARLAQALAGFDEANRVSGVDDSVVTLVMSEFGRTVRPGSGGGSEHAWGSHWWLMGGPVAGANVVGTFPSPVLGGPDDGDAGRNGRFVPTTSSDQVGATLMQWMGLPSGDIEEVFPYLANFSTKTLPLLRA